MSGDVFLTPFPLNNFLKFYLLRRLLGSWDQSFCLKKKHIRKTKVNSMVTTTILLASVNDQLHRSFRMDSVDVLYIN